VVTAHWIEAQVMDTSRGSHRVLKMWADLVRFCQVPGKHTGSHLATAFLHVIDRLSVANKVGFFLFVLVLLYLFLCCYTYVDISRVDNT
jgi:hypothetical protein